MSLTAGTDEQVNNELVWEHHLQVERRVNTSILQQHVELNDAVRKCVSIYWELFAAQRVSACSVFSAIELLHRYVAVCASSYKFQRVGAACLWIAMKVAYGQDVPMCARVLATHWNDVAPRPSSHVAPHFWVNWRKLVGAEVQVLKKLQYDVLTVTAHDMFVLLMRLHDQGNDQAVFARGVQMLISITLLRDEVYYLPSQIAVAVALTCNIDVGGKYIVPHWQEVFAWVQRFLD